MRRGIDLDMARNLDASLLAGLSIRSTETIIGMNIMLLETIYLVDRMNLYFKRRAGARVGLL
jgi:hypothetical protein